MNTVAELPLVRMLVEMTVAGTPVRGVRVERVRDDELILTLPDDSEPEARPTIGQSVVLRWPAGSRGRWVMRATVVPAPEDDQIAVLLKGSPDLEQKRQFFRGGGGERIRLLYGGSEDPAVSPGWVQDISERGARSHFADVRVRIGDLVTAQVDLDGQTVAVAGTVLRMGVLPDDVGAYSMRVEVVVLFDSEEQQASVIRRYVFRQQLLTRHDDD